MDIIVKYDQYEKLITKVESYKDLVKGVCQSFKYILKNNFTLYYFDEEGDKITLSNQEDFEAVQNTESIEIIVETNGEELQMTDDSFQKLNKSVKETVNQFRKLSSSVSNHETQEQIDQEQIIQPLEPVVQQQEKQESEQVLKEQQRKNILTELQSTIAHLKAQILLIENDDKESKLRAKLEKLEQPQPNTTSLREDLMNIELITQIEEAEKKLLTLNKTEKSELKQNYHYLQKQINQIAIKREKFNLQYLVLNKDYNKQVQKIELAIVKNQKKNDKQLKQLKQLLKQYEQKIVQAQKKKCDLDSIQYMNKDQLEKYLDQQTKEEMKLRKQKQEALKKEKQQMDQIINLENTIQVQKVVSSEDSFDLD